MEKSKSKIWLFIIIALFIWIIVSSNSDVKETVQNVLKSDYSENTFRIIASSENEDMEQILTDYANKEGIDLQIEYAGTLDVMEKLNSGEKYDAVWVSNSIWLYMLDSSIKTSNSESTSTNPVVFGIKKSKAEELGFIGKEIYTNDILNSIENGSLKFSMANPTRTNSGATAYLGLLSTIAGNPEVLKEQDLQNPVVREKLIKTFSGLERSSGSEDFLEEMFLNGNYEAVVTYEASIINMNKKLEANGEEILYVLYPVDGVSISDSPFAYINNGDLNKKDQFLKLQSYILSNEGQTKLAQTGRRTWFGGTNSNADKELFNPDWGIDTTKYIVPIKFPSTKIINEALAMYQTELRKPVHTVFGLDYSGSMTGDGYEELTAAMEYILNEEEAKKDLLQFSEKDKITVIPFSTNVIDVWNTDNGLKTGNLLNNIRELRPSGSTNIYDTSIEALRVLSKEDLNTYNCSIILMTDGQSNMGEYNDLQRIYNSMKQNIPIYSITFGDAYDYELQDIAELTNAKVFDGKTDLLKAFKEVRGYN